jgi:monofunctional biosynthetic peptidoglycan transglycosylase
MNGQQDQYHPQGTSVEKPELPSKRRRWWHYLFYGLSLIVLGELVFFAWHWPDWEALRQGKVPESALIADYKEQREDDPKLPELRWKPIEKSIPRSLKKVFVIAEDSRFYQHGGVDFEAIREAIDYNWRHGKILLGASTISQQTAKNMFLSLSRNPLRKAHEVLFTYLLESFLTKDQILHMYLNVAEFGPGIYGIEAAARAYYRTGAHNLSQAQAIELAASLPSPKKHNPKSRTRAFQRRYHRIASTMRVMDQYVASNTSAKKANMEELQKKLEELRREMNENPTEPAPTAASELSSVPAEGPQSPGTTLPPAAAMELPGAEAAATEAPSASLEELTESTGPEAAGEASETSSEPSSHATETPQP